MTHVWDWWLVRMCDVTHLEVRWFCVTWLNHKCEVTHVALHDSTIRVTRLKWLGAWGVSIINVMALRDETQGVTRLNWDVSHILYVIRLNVSTRLNGECCSMSQCLNLWCVSIINVMALRDETQSWVSSRRAITFIHAYVAQCLCCSMSQCLYLWCVSIINVMALRDETQSVIEARV